MVHNRHVAVGDVHAMQKEQAVLPSWHGRGTAVTAAWHVADTVVADAVAGGWHGRCCERTPAGSGWSEWLTEASCEQLPLWLGAVLRCEDLMRSVYAEVAQDLQVVRGNL